MKPKPNLTAPTAALLLLNVLLLGSCDLFGMKQANSGVAAFAYTAASPLALVDFSKAISGKLTLTVNGAAGKEIFLVKANPTDAEVVATGVGLAAPKVLTSAPPRAPIPDLPRAQRFNEQGGAKWSAANRSRSVSRNASVSYAENATKTIGTDFKMFWVDKPDGTWEQKKAFLRAIGDHSYIWVAEDNYTGSSAAADETVSSQKAADLASKFEDVFTNVTNLYGYEFGGGPGGDGGMDGDQHISILIYDIDFDVASSRAGNGGTMGYFWAKDEFTQPQLGTTTPKTNQAEIFYLDAYFTESSFEQTISTLAHEYTHMILYNQKNIKNGQDAPAWYNEMCAMVAEDLVVANLGYDPVTVGAQNRLPDFLSNYAVSGVTDWLDGDDVLRSYASAFAFGAFLERSYGGAEFFHSMMGNSKVGQEAITEAMSAMGSPGGFKKAFESYLSALVYTTPPVGSSVFTLNTDVTKTLAGTPYTAQKIDLWNLTQLDDAQALGPLMYGNTAANQKLLRPWGFTVHRLAASATNSQSFTLTAPSTSSVEYWVMVK